MRRFYIRDLPAQWTTIALPPSEATHASRVLRVRPGDQVTVLNGMGTRALARVKCIDQKRVDLELIQAERESPPPFLITLFPALTKPKSMDWLVEKATELGVGRIQPIITERVIPRLNAVEAVKKTEKWQRTAIEALKQCGGAWLPSIQSPEPLAGVVAESPSFDCHIVASLLPGATRLRNPLSVLKPGTRPSSPIQIGIWIGPEGDFTHRETETLINAGAVPVSLGTNVLRSETAAICAISLIRYEMECLA